METVFKYQIGDILVSKISGFEGIVVGRVEHMNGVIQYLITPQRLKPDGSEINSEWIDEGILIKIGIS